MKPKSWRDIPEEPLNNRITRRVVNTEHLTIAKIRLDRGALVPLHHHESEQVTMLESGRVLFRMAGQEFLLEPGQLIEIPSGLPHEVEALEDSVATDIFSPRREDWIRGDDAYLRT